MRFGRDEYGYDCISEGHTGGCGDETLLVDVMVRPSSIVRVQRLALSFAMVLRRRRSLSSG